MHLCFLHISVLNPFFGPQIFFNNPSVYKIFYLFFSFKYLFNYEFSKLNVKTVLTHMRGFRSCIGIPFKRMIFLIGSLGCYHVQIRALTCVC